MAWCCPTSGLEILLQETPCNTEKTIKCICGLSTKHSTLVSNCAQRCLYQGPIRPPFSEGRLWSHQLYLMTNLNTLGDCVFLLRWPWMYISQWTQARFYVFLDIWALAGGHFIDIFHEMSILAEFFLPMQTFIDLVSVPPIARSVAKSERWKAHAQSGRAFAETTILGSMFCISSLQDIDYMKGPRGVLRERSPKVVEDLFGEGSNNAHVIIPSPCAEPQIWSTSMLKSL